MPRKQKRDKRKKKDSDERCPARAKRTYHSEDCQCGCVEEGATVPVKGHTKSSGGFWSSASACCRSFLERHDPGKVIPRTTPSASHHSNQPCRCKSRSRHQSQSAKGSRSRTSPAASRSKSHEPVRKKSQTQCPVCVASCPRVPPDRKKKRKGCCGRSGKRGGKDDPQNIEKYFSDLAKRVKRLNPCMQADIKHRFSEVVDSAGSRSHASRTREDDECDDKRKQRKPQKSRNKRSRSDSRSHDREQRSDSPRYRNVCDDYTCPAADRSRSKTKKQKPKKDKSRSGERARSSSPPRHRPVCDDYTCPDKPKRSHSKAKKQKTKKDKSRDKRPKESKSESQRSTSPHPGHHICDDHTCPASGKKSKKQRRRCCGGNKKRDKSRGGGGGGGGGTCPKASQSESRRSTRTRSDSPHPGHRQTCDRRTCPEAQRRTRSKSKKSKRTTCCRGRKSGGKHPKKSKSESSSKQHRVCDKHTCPDAQRRSRSKSKKQERGKRPRETKSESRRSASPHRTHRTCDERTCPESQRRSRSKKQKRRCCRGGKSGEKRPKKSKSESSPPRRSSSPYTCDDYTCPEMRGRSKKRGKKKKDSRSRTRSDSGAHRRGRSHSPSCPAKYPHDKKTNRSVSFSK